MKVNKAVAPNSIPRNVLKDLKSGFWKPLSDMINTSFITGTFPNAFKVKNVIPINKKSRMLNCDNYWPISLLSKIYEKMMDFWLKSSPNENKSLSTFQFGFSIKNSSNHIYISLTEIIHPSSTCHQLVFRVLTNLQENIWCCWPQETCC